MSDYWTNYRLRKIEEAKLELQFREESSPSAIFYHKIIGLIGDLIAWLIIAIFVYIWWQTRGQTVQLTCSDISTDLCNTCYGEIKQIIQNGVNNINWSLNG